MTFNIIGAGRLGKNIALSLLTHTNNQLLAVCNHSLTSAANAVNILGAGTATHLLTDLPAVELTFITTPDDRIADIANVLPASSGVVVHCSGVLSSDVLAPLKEKGCHVASLHPLKAFRDNHLQHDAFQDCDCMVEGDKYAVDLLTELFTAMGARVMPITAEKKSTYHAAAVMASNYLVTLAGCAIELLMTSGLTETQAKGITERLMDSSLKNIQNTSHVSAALTGPLARGDMSTIDKHLHAIDRPEMNTLYRAAALATLPFTHLDHASLTALTERLNEH